MEHLAQLVDEAAKNAQPIAQLSIENTFDVDESYAIQAASIERRYARGEKLIGLKMGFTSEAKMKQMGVHDMIWGRLTDAMLIDNGGTIDMGKYIHPRAEPEIYFSINRDINEALTPEQCREAVDAVGAAIEIIDSRYENFKFSLEDVIADNCSSTGVVLGERQAPTIDLSDLRMTIEIDGEVKHEGTSAAILGDPWKSLAAATRLAAQYKQPIRKGDIIMAGAATAAEFLQAGMQVAADVEGLGRVEFGVR